MGQPYDELPEDLFDAAEFQEHCEAQQAGGGGAFSASAQEATLVGYVAGNKLRSALRWFLGFASVNTTESPAVEGGSEPPPVEEEEEEEETPTEEEIAAASYLLHREPPARHPIFPQLYCHSVSFVGQGLTTTPNEVIAVDGPFFDYLGEPIRYTPYEKYLLTCRYKSFGRVRFLSDDEMAGYDPPYAYEWLRNTSIEIGPAVQALTADGSSMLLYREGGLETAGAGGTPLAFPAPIAELMTKSNMTVKWMGVPHEWLSDNDYYLYPTKVIAGLGKINDADFIGLAKGTCLLLAAQFDSILYPVAPADPALPLGGYDVTFNFEHFDPTKGVEDDPPGESEYRGHRLFPYRVDGKWYFANRENDTDELLPLTEMYKVFQHWADAS